MSHFDISLPDKGVTEQTPIHLGPGAFGLLTNCRLLDAVEQIVGPEIYSNPIQHARIKPPEREAPEELRKGSLMGQTDWHQDRGVHLPEADQTDILTVWSAGHRCNGRKRLPPCDPRRPERACDALREQRQLHPSRPADWSRDTRTYPPGRRAVHASPLSALVAFEHKRRHPLELRPALPPSRPGNWPPVVAWLRRPQPPRSRQRHFRPARLRRSLASGTHSHGRRGAEQGQSVDGGRADLRLVGRVAVTYKGVKAFLKSYANTY